MLGVAVHEAGHFVAARERGFEVGVLEVIQPVHQRGFLHGSAEIMLIRGIESDSDLDTYLKDRIIVLNAGALAQALIENED